MGLGFLWRINRKEIDYIMNTTTIIQIGNSDDKLTQREWANFVYDIQFFLKFKVKHFSGGSSCSESWQNYCWVVEGEFTESDYAKLTAIKEKYKQDSIAITIGDTKFI